MSRVRPTRRAAALWFVLSLSCVQPNLRAENGRNFAGSYQIQTVRSDGSSVSFVFSLKLFNYSGSNVTDANIAFVGRLASPDSQALDYRGSFDLVSVKYRKFVDLKGSFAVPDSEYKQWQRGAMPNLIVTYTNEAGETVHNNVELTRNR